MLSTKNKRKINTVIKPYKNLGNKDCSVCGKLFSRFPGEEAYKFRKRNQCSEKCSNTWKEEILVENIRKSLKKIKCELCLNEFLPINGNQRFCGSKRYKVGCSWQHQRDINKRKKHDYKMRGSRAFWLNTTKIIR